MILETARAILSLIQPLTGTRSSGTTTVRANPGPSATLPANRHAVPIVGGALRHDLLLKTAPNPATADHSWTVASGGTAVSMVSVLGGAQYNLAAGTQFRWWPAIAGIEAVSSIAAPGFVGGAPATRLAALKDVRIFEQLQTPAGLDVFGASLSQFPSAMLVWDSSSPADGQGDVPLGRRSARAGRGITIEKHTWDLFVVTSRADMDPARREEGLAIVDELKATMTDRQSVDGEVFSMLGLSIQGSYRQAVTPSFYVYRIRFMTTSALKRRDGRTFDDWDRTRLDIDTATTPAFPIVENNRINMP